MTSPDLPSPRSVALASRLATCLATLTMALSASPAFAAEPSPAPIATTGTRAFDIPAGPLAEALDRFARVSGHNIAYDDDLVAGLRSPGVQGTHAPFDALTHLLRGTALSAQSPAGGFQLIKAATATPLSASADQPAGPIPPREPREIDGEALLPAVIVHGTVMDDPLAQRMSLSAAKIIIARNEIEAFGDASMGEVIRRMPSISFGGPPGENNDARIRGLNKEYTQILIDGQPAPGRDFAIDQIPAHLVERLEIIRSTTANVDNQGIAGTVNIVLRKPPKERQARWQASVGTTPDAPGDGRSGSFGMNHGDARDGFRYQVDGIVQNRFGVRTKDRRDYNNGEQTLTNREQDFEVREHQEVGLNARLAWRINAQDEWRLDPRFLYSSEDKARDRLKKADLSEAERMDQVKTRQFLGLNGQWQRTVSKHERHTLGFNLQGADTVTDKIDRKGTAGQAFTALPAFVGGNDDKVLERGITLRAASQRRVAEIHALDFGIELGQMNWDQRKLAWKQISQADTVRTSFGVAETKLAVYGQDEILIGERHVFTPGLRLEHTHTRTTAPGSPVRAQDHLQPSPSLHWLSNIDAHTNWRASITRSIRRPKFEDLSVLPETKSGTTANPDAAGNPDLRPETAWGLETSFERYFARKAGVASINFFHRDMKDLIEKRIDLDSDSGRYVQRPINVGQARTWGVEIDGSRRFDLNAVHALTLRGNYSWMDSEVNDPATGGQRPINDQPRHILNAGFDYEYKPLKLKLGAHYNQVGRLQKVDLVGANVRTQRQDPSRYLDLSASCPIGRDLLVRLSALNVLEAEKNRPRTTVRPNGSVALFEQEDESSARSFQIRIEGKF